MEINVALCQFPLIWQDPAANRDYFDNKLAALRPDTDVVILPEMFSTGFTMQPAAVPEEEAAITLVWMQEKARVYDTALVGSIVYPENDQFYNRLLFVEPGGQTYQYDKRHTFTLAGEHEVYTAGKTRLQLEFRGFVFCPMICYDLRFPVWSRNTEDYDVLLYVANWPAPRIGAWDSLLQARAIENMAYCIGVNRIGTDENGLQYTGHSAVYDSLGNRDLFCENEGIGYTTLSRTGIMENREKLRFLDDRDSFNLLG